MNLQYIAGFFDGEGSASLVISKREKSTYGYTFKPKIDIIQKTKGILWRISNFLFLGRVRKANSNIYSLTIRRYNECLKFIHYLEPLVIEKREQLRLLKKAIKILKDRGKGRKSFLSKEKMLYLTDLTKKIRALNGDKHSVHDINEVRRAIENFDIEKHLEYLEQVKEKTMKNLESSWKTVS